MAELFFNTSRKHEKQIFKKGFKKIFFCLQLATIPRNKIFKGMHFSYQRKLYTGFINQFWILFAKRKSYNHIFSIYKD